MSEENKMTEESKKTIIAFIAGLLVGGLLVFIFNEPTNNKAATGDNQMDGVENVSKNDNNMEEENMNEETPSTPTTAEAPREITNGSGSIQVDNQSAGSRVQLSEVELPMSDGWIGVRDYENGQMTGLLGVARFSASEGLIPEVVTLLRATEAGKTYAVVFYSDNGDKTFSLATDAQLSGTMETFVAR